MRRSGPCPESVSYTHLDVYKRQLQDLGRTNRIMEGEGEFVGPDAYSQFGQLANMFYNGGPGLLIHPLWQAANAYFVSLRLEQEPRPDFVRYSFTRCV